MLRFTAFVLLAVASASAMPTSLELQSRQLGLGLSCLGSGCSLATKCCDGATCVPLPATVPTLPLVPPTLPSAVCLPELVSGLCAVLTCTADTDCCGTVGQMSFECTNALNLPSLGLCLPKGLLPAGVPGAGGSPTLPGLGGILSGLPILSGLTTSPTTLPLVADE